MRRSLLLVVPDQALSFFLRYILENEFDVNCIARGDDTVLLNGKNRAEILIINWLLPGVSGVELYRRLRLNKTTEQLPIILLVDSTDEGNRIRDLVTGSACTVCTTICGEEIKRQVRNMLSKISSPDSGKFAVGRIVLDLANHCLEHENKKVHLTPIKFRLLRFFMENPGQILSREQLFTNAWEPHLRSSFSKRTVDVHVARLRCDLVSIFNRNVLMNSRGIGYFLETDFD